MNFSEATKKMENWNIGRYPPEYNKAIHGPYDPARFYGKPDTPFGQVKLGELASWFARREKTPRSTIALISRGFWTWQHSFGLAKRAGLSITLQALVLNMALFYYLNYGRIKHHKQFKYH